MNDDYTNPDIVEDDDVILEDDSLSLEQKIKVLRDKLKVALKERDLNLAGWQRAKADLVNFKRIAHEDETKQVRNATKQVLLDLLPVLDSFDMAIASASWETIDPTWRKGMEGVYQQALSAARGHGLEQFTPEKGAPFDPELHEPVGVEAGDGATDHTIAKVLQKGYRLNDTVIRPATVIIFSTEN